jgi:SAM-dependent methyltransferase
MGNEFKGKAAHSAEHFGDTRDHWWNRDFLELMARRWKLDAVHDVLDVGCGIGHWSALLSSVLPRDVRVTGIDREPSWVEEATKRARARGVGDRFSFLQGDATRLPFADDTFDLTTCQTVLIHLRDPAAAIAEMTRVTKPGGLVAVAEPNNVSETLLLDTITNRAPVDDVVEIVRFHLTCERGKVALGKGDSSLGDRVHGLFVAQGLVDVQAYVNDKATTIAPPYATDAERAFVEDARDHVRRRFWNWSEEETRRLFVAGGGREDDFAGHFARGLAFRENILRGIDDGTYHGIVGGPFYLVAGRKPVAR